MASSEDFTPPKEEEEAAVPEEEDREAPVWNKTVDELVSFLEEKGLIHADSKVTLSAEGLCTLALKYDGAEIYWWDLENLDPESGSIRHMRVSGRKARLIYMEPVRLLCRRKTVLLHFY